MGKEGFEKKGKDKVLGLGTTNKISEEQSTATIHVTVYICDGEPVAAAMAAMAACFCAMRRELCGRGMDDGGSCWGEATAGDGLEVELIECVVCSGEPVTGSREERADGADSGAEVVSGAEPEVDSDAEFEFICFSSACTRLSSSLFCSRKCELCERKCVTSSRTASA